ncbi:hypothetical protein MMC30_001978 [Trapelia coarctata]|nr:hypothetical protein [Trapelia coarctata]
MQTLNEPVTFYGLPNEILQEILSDDVLSKPDLCSLALTAYHDLLHTLVSRPELGYLVRSIVLGCRTPASTDYPQQLQTQAMCILNMLPSLHTLEVHCRMSPARCGSGFLEVPMQFLRKAIIYDPLPAGDMGKLMLLPNVTEISTQFRPNLKDRESDHLILGRLAGKSPLKSLHLAYVDGAEPPELLAVPKALEVFCFMDDWNNERQCVSPKGIYSLLAPACMTLVDLSLETWWDTSKKTRADGSSINFSRFPSLKYLKTDRLYCFPKDEEDKFGARRGLYRRLPATLEYLSIYFQPGSNSCIPFEYDAHHNVLENEHRYTWILELAQNKASYFPDLKNVILTEGRSDVSRHNTETEEAEDLLDASKTLLDIYTPAKVHLSVSLMPDDPTSDPTVGADGTP